jgi:hypothetical protein
LRCPRGVALGWRYLVDDLIFADRLVRLQQSLQTELGYYFFCHENLQDDPTIQRLRHWLGNAFETDSTSA